MRRQYRSTSVLVWTPHEYAPPFPATPSLVGVSASASSSACLARAGTAHARTHARLHTPSRRPPAASAGYPPADQPPTRSTGYRARIRPSSRPLVRSGWMSSGATAGRMRSCMRPSHRVQPLLLGRGGKHRATSLGRSAATDRSCSRPAPPPSPCASTACSNASSRTSCRRSSPRRP